MEKKLFFTCYSTILLRNRIRHFDHQENHEVLFWPDDDDDDDGENRLVNGEKDLGDFSTPPLPSASNSVDFSPISASDTQAFTLVLVLRCISHS